MSCQLRMCWFVEFIFVGFFVVCLFVLLFNGMSEGPVLQTGFVVGGCDL